MFFCGWELLRPHGPAAGNGVRRENISISNGFCDTRMQILRTWDTRLAGVRVEKVSRDAGTTCFPTVFCVFQLIIEFLRVKTFTILCGA